MATNNNTAVLHRKEWQQMTPAPTASIAGAFVINGGSGNQDKALYVASNTAHYFYSHGQDGFSQIPSGAIAGTFGAGACGAYSPWSITYTANGGTTTTVTVAAATHNINGFAEGETIEFISAGTATGQRRNITQVRNNAGTGTITLTMDSAVNTAILNTHTFRLSTGRFFVMGAGTTAAGSWKVFDNGTYAWQANLSTTNLPASWATDGRAVNTLVMANVMANGTATSGSTTTVVDSAKSWTVDGYKNMYVLIVDGTGEGQLAKITSNTATTLTFAAVTTAIDNTSVYQIQDSKAYYATGVATSGSATTLVNSAKTWTTNQWTNYQVRIISGTGVGQIRNISSNTGTTLTIPTGATIDATSVYVIEGNEDNIYLAGNNAVTVYKYSISGNTWAVMAPTTARGAAPGLGMCFDWVGDTSATAWGDESDIQDGRYIYSMRGGAGALIDRFDIAGGTAGAGAWAAVTYIGTETFTTGSSAYQSGRYLYMRQNATNRFFRFDIVGNVIIGWNTDTYTDGAALLGQKIWVKNLDATATVKWVYSLANTGTTLRRAMII